MRRGMPLNKQIDSHHWVDGMNELQIREREQLSDAELVAELTTVGPKAVKGRWGTPPPMRYVPIPFGPPVGWAPLNTSSTLVSPATSGVTASTSARPPAVRCS